MVKAMGMCRADQNSSESIKGFILIPVTTGQKSIIVPEFYNSNCFSLMTSTNHLDIYRPVLRGVGEVQPEFSLPRSLLYQDISTLKIAPPSMHADKCFCLSWTCGFSFSYLGWIQITIWIQFFLFCLLLFLTQIHVKWRQEDKQN